jgi:glycerol-3-phosphate dehydrogenase
VNRQAPALGEGLLDLLVIGGGITGAGVALDAALQGWRVGLIDKGDFASATSSSSSKLVHGGLRYLEHGNFHLVYEALHERRRLLVNAPHLVRRLRFVIPFYAGSRITPWKWRLGLALYDLLAGKGTIRRSSLLSKDQVSRDVPGLTRHGLLGGAAYHDAQMDDARLCLEVIRTAAREGATAANYVEAVGFAHEAGRLAGVRAVDRLSGTEMVIRARQVLNATGPWVDALRHLAGDNGQSMVFHTKGVHLICPPSGLTSALLLLHPDDGRVFFIIPWEGERDSSGGWRTPPKTLIGTTDTPWAGPPRALNATGEDIDYLLRGHNHYRMPRWSEADILGTFAGLRPLLRGKPKDPSAVSREYRIFTSPSGLMSVAGGKYTTYRKMAEEIARAVARRLGRPYYGLTADYRLDGAPEQPWDDFAPSAVAHLEQRYPLTRENAWHLVARYGRRAAEVAADLTQHPNLAAKVVPGEEDMMVEFAYQKRYEMAIFAEDFLLRRMRLGMWRPELLRAVPEPLRDLLPANAAAQRG